PALRLAETEADPVAEEAVAGFLPQAFGGAEEGAALRGEVVEREAEAAVQVGVRARAEPFGLTVDDVCRLDEQRVEMLVALALRSVGRVHDRRPQIPERDLLAVDLDLQ